MAITATHLDQGGVSTDATGNSTGSVSPDGGSLLLLFLAIGDVGVSTVSGFGVTWTQAVAHQRGTSAQHGAIWWAVMPGTPGSDTVDFTFSGTAGSHAWELVQVDGADTSDDPIVQFADGEDSDDEVSLSSSVTGNNATFAQVIENSGSVTITAAGGATLLGTPVGGLASPSMTHAVEYIVPGSQTMSFTVSGTPLPTLAIIEVAEQTAVQHEGEAALSGAGTLTAAADQTFEAATTLSGTGDLTAEAVRIVPAASALTGSGDLTAAADQTFEAASALTGTGALAAEAVRIVPAAAALTGTGSLTASAFPQQEAEASLSGSGSLTAEALRIAEVASALSGTGDLSAAADQTFEAASTLTGTGDLSAEAIRQHEGASALTGTGDLSATAVRVQPAEAQLSGTGDLSAVGTAIVKYFTPPTDLVGAPVDADSRHAWDPTPFKLMRHFAKRAVGRNVFILSDDTVTENNPADITPPNPTVKRAFLGGRAERYRVSATEAALLEAAGYTVQEVED